MRKLARRLRPSRLLTPRRWQRPQWPGWRRFLAAALAVVFAALTVAGLAQVRVDTGIGSFLPAGDRSFEAVEDKARSFGGDPVVVLLRSGQPRELMTEQAKLVRLLRLEGELSRLPDAAAVYGPATALNQTAAAAQNMLARISGQRDALRIQAEKKARQAGASPAAAAAAGRDAVAQFDRRYGALLAQGLPAGLPTLRNPDFARTVLFDDAGRPRPQWHWMLPDKHTVAVLVRPREELDQAAAARLTDAVRATVDRAHLGAEVTVTGVPVVTSALTERAQRELPLLGSIAVVAVGLVFLFSPWSARRRSRLRPLLAAVAGTALTVAAFGWLDHPLSLGVVAFLPILVGIGSDFPVYLSQPGYLRRALVAAAAAVAGFGSLALSPLPFVRELGLALAAGIVVTVGASVILRRAWGTVSPSAAEPGDEDAVERRQAAPIWQRAAALTAAATVAVAGLALLPRLDVETRPDQLAQGLPELADARHAEKVLGSGSEVSIVLRGQNVLRPEALRWAQRAEAAVVRGYGDAMRPIITMPDLLAFLGDKPTAQQIAAGSRLVPSYLLSAAVRPDNRAALLTFGVRLRDTDQQRVLLNEVREALPPTPKGFDAELVGLPVAAVRGLDLVSGGRGLINLVGIAVAGLVLVAGLPRRRDAGRAMLTVLLATGWVVALAWLVFGLLNPLTVAIGSLTVATGCEFAVMLAGASRRWDHRLWRSVTTAAVAGTVGYLVLALSGVAVLREFGLLLASSVALSYLAALTVTWALPASCDPSNRDDDNGLSGAPAHRKEVAV